MATPAEKLAESLVELEKLQNERGIAIIKADDLSRTHKERLIKNGFIREVIKGWYISSLTDEKQGETASWYISFWNFIALYIDSRFGKDWCLSPEQSLSLHSGNFMVPPQLLIRSPKASNNRVNLLHGSSVFDSKVEIPHHNERNEIEGVQVYSLEAGLVDVSSDFYTRHPTDARTCLAMIKDSSGVLAKLLDGGKSVVAGRLAGAFRNIGNDKIANGIMDTMKSAGYDVRENDPLQDLTPIKLSIRSQSPYVNRIRLMWESMREIVIDHFPKAPGLPSDQREYLKLMEDIYLTDAYHSLSIERYQVTPDLVERVRTGDWDPENNEEDKKQKEAMAARGYWLAYQRVRESVKRVLNKENAGIVADEDHSDWYRELFAPSVTAGFIKPSDLAGYRNDQVYIGKSKHVPLNKNAMRDVMPELFKLLQNEEEASVRAVLGHFIFVFIHPYMDGNGRMGRFLMNVMLASGGYPWTVIPVEKRDDYMNALEAASVDQDISKFAGFIGWLVNEGLIGKPVAKI